MNTSHKTAQIIDINAFREQRQKEGPATFTPIPAMLVWVPVWVMVPFLPAT